MTQPKILLSRGEEGNRRGTKFEDAIAYLLGRLGYEIVDQNYDIECITKKIHKKNSHGIDLFVKRPFDSSFPFRIPIQKNLVISCKSS